MTDGRLQDVEPMPSDVVVDGYSDLARSHGEAPEPPREARRRRRGPGAILFELLRRLWIPMVIVIVLAAGGFAVSRLHGIFGSDSSLTYGDTASDDTEPVDPKIMRYEVFGPPGTTAQISFFNGNGDPQFLEEVPLPWTLEFPIIGAAGVGSVAAQGDSDSLGCRILVDDVVKSEKIEAHEASTFAACMLKAA